MQFLTKQLVTFAGLGLTTDMWNTANREGCGVSGLRLKAYAPQSFVNDIRVNYYGSDEAICIPGGTSFKEAQQMIAKDPNSIAEIAGQVGLFYRPGCQQKDQIVLGPDQFIRDAVAAGLKHGYPLQGEEPVFYAKNIAIPEPLYVNTSDGGRFIDVHHTQTPAGSVRVNLPDDPADKTVENVKRAFEVALQEKGFEPLPWGQTFSLFLDAKCEGSELGDNWRLSGSEYSGFTELSSLQDGAVVFSKISYMQVDVKKPTGECEHFSGNTSFMSVKEQMAQSIRPDLTADQVELFYEAEGHEATKIVLAKDAKIADALAWMESNGYGRSTMLFTQELLPGSSPSDSPMPKDFVWPETGGRTGNKDEKSDKTKNTAPDAGDEEENNGKTAWWIWLASIAGGVVGVGLLALLVYTINKSPGEDPGNDGGNFEFYDSSDSSDSEEETNSECGTPSGGRPSKKKSAKDSVDTSG